MAYLTCYDQSQLWILFVNSEFTGQVFLKTFKELGRLPRTIYPAVDVEAFGKKMEVKKEDQWLIKWVRFEILEQASAI